MHRDTKIGLALAILLIGFAGALCFPRHSAVDVSALELEGADELDAAIELLPVRAYTERGTKSLLDVVELTAPAASGPAPFSPGDLQFQPGRTPEQVAIVPNPIPSTNPDTLPTNDRPDGPHGRSVSTPKSTASPADVQFHVVQPGETLSAIASRYLGSAAKFPEIFEANRDVLDSPDDLKLSMKLRIPRRSDERAQMADRPGSVPRR